MPTNRHVQKEKVATYASVLLDAALAAGGQDAVLEVRDQAERIIRIMRSNMDLSSSLQDSSYTPEQRNSLARNVFAQAHPVLIDVLAVMAERGDFALLSRVWESYGEQVERKLNVTVVDVTTVVPLDDHLREVITEKLSADLGKKVVLLANLAPRKIRGVESHGMLLCAANADDSKLSLLTVDSDMEDGCEIG